MRNELNIFSTTRTFLFLPSNNEYILVDVTEAVVMTTGVEPETMNFLITDFNARAT